MKWFYGRKGLCLWVSLFLTSLYSEDSESSYYTSAKSTKDGIVIVRNFKFEQETLSMVCPTNWLATYLTGDTVISLRQPSEFSHTIVLSRCRLEIIPTNEVHAASFYSTRIQQNIPVNFIKDSRPVDSMTGAIYPQRYILSASSNAAPTRITVFFMSPPYLYTRTLDVKTRLMGNLRSDFTSLLRSISIKQFEDKNAEKSETEGSVD